MTGTAGAVEYRNLNRWLLGCLLVGFAWWLVWTMDLIGLTSELRTCGSVRILGRECAFCGMTRAVASLLDGDLAGAHGFNPAVIPVSLLLILETVARVVLAAWLVPDTARAGVMRTDKAAHVALAVLLTLLLVAG